MSPAPFGADNIFVVHAGGSESETIPDEFSRISDMEQVAKVLALTALDVCSLPPA